MMTTPGFVIESEDIAVMFVSGHQREFGSHTAEYVIGWKRVMQMILCVFGDNNKMDDIMKTLLKLLKDWAKDDWMGRGKVQVPVDLQITEEEFLPDDIRQVKIKFHHELPTKLRFYVKNKKKQIDTLKTRVLASLASMVNNEDVQSLELPRGLKEDLKDFKLNIWRKGLYKGPGNENDKSKKWYAMLFDEL